MRILLPLILIIGLGVQWFAPREASLDAVAEELAEKSPKPGPAAEPVPTRTSGALPTTRADVQSRTAASTPERDLKPLSQRNGPRETREDTRSGHQEQAAGQRQQRAPRQTRPSEAEEGWNEPEERSQADTARARDLPEGKSIVDLLQEDYEGALKLIYESGAEKWSNGNRLMREVAEWVMEEASLQEQLAWVESLPDGPMKGVAAGRVIEEWGSDDAIQSLEWAFTMEDQAARGAALSAAFAKWAAGVGGGDREAGAEMIDSLETERDRDLALNGYASGLLRADPELALDLAKSITMRGLRDAAVNRLSGQISRMNQEGGE